MARFIPREKVVPFRQELAITSTTSTNSDVIIATIPAYNVVWADFAIEVQTNAVTCTIETDSTYGNITAYSEQIPPGVTNMRKLVLGTPVNVGTAYGPHVITVKIRSSVSGQHGVFRALIFMHGERRE
jgi:hypothetical protein